MDDPVQIQSDATLPEVMCPGCRVRMRAVGKRSMVRTARLVLIRYHCGSCKFETFRIVKDD